MTSQCVRDTEHQRRVSRAQSRSTRTRWLGAHATSLLMRSTRRSGRRPGNDLQVSRSLCEVCNLQVQSSAQARLHVNSRTHLRRLRATGMKTAITFGHEECEVAGLDLKQPLSSQSRDSRQTPPTDLQVSRSLCEVCNLQVQSSAQARLHVNSRTHLRRLRATGGHGQVGRGLRPLALSSVVMQSTLELKSLPVETTSPAGLFSNFNTMDPVQKAVINHTFGVHMETTKRQMTCCHTCQLRFNSQPTNQDEAPGLEEEPEGAMCHRTGGFLLQPWSLILVGWLSEEETAKKLLYCSLCKAQTSSSLLRGSGLQNKSFHCQTCDVHVNSEVQLKQHISSRRHKDRMAGKPSKPKSSPYSKQSTTATDFGAL
ncbi:hypothetical protein CRUP_033902 [Coryphaenoides rupestris]|nr:hypothetical protein CRUP_033902 [Coryphaenoides rupestris]